VLKLNPHNFCEAAKAKPALVIRSWTRLQPSYGFVGLDMGTRGGLPSA